MSQLAEPQHRMDVYKPKLKLELGSLLHQLHLKQLGCMGKYIVWVVDGDLLRTFVDIDFVAGGNPGRYAYTPDNELWLENMKNSHDMLATIYHEYIECQIMTLCGRTYNQSHDIAASLEQRWRQGHKS